MIHKHTGRASSAMLTVAGLMLAGCCSYRPPGPPVPPEELTSVPRLAQTGYVFTIKHHQSDRPQHKNAIVTVLQTQVNPDTFGLVFLQTEERGHKGKGMLCPKADVLQKTDGTPDVALTCHQDVGNTRETLTVGTASSDFCSGLREQHGAQLIVTPEECEGEYGDGEACICYNIKHTRLTAYAEQTTGRLPPTDGSGSGGRRR